MRRLRALRGGKQRFEMNQQKQAEKKAAATMERNVEKTNPAQAEATGLHKAKVARGKKKLQKKAAADKEKQRVFVVDGEGKDKIAFHLDDDSNE